VQALRPGQWIVAPYKSVKTAWSTIRAWKDWRKLDVTIYRAEGDKVVIQRKP